MGQPRILAWWSWKGSAWSSSPVALGLVECFPCGSLISTSRPTDTGSPGAMPGNVYFKVPRWLWGSTRFGTTALVLSAKRRRPTYWLNIWITLVLGCWQHRPQPPPLLNGSTMEGLSKEPGYFPATKENRVYLLYERSAFQTWGVSYLTACFSLLQDKYIQLFSTISKCTLHCHLSLLCPLQSICISHQIWCLSWDIRL